MSDNKTECDQKDTYEDPDVQVTEFSKISHELIHPLLHFTNPRRFVVRMFSELVVF